MQDFMAVAYKRSLQAVEIIDVRYNCREVSIGFKVKGVFTPKAFHQRKISLRLITDEGPRMVSGRLITEKSPLPRIDCFRYRFLPDKPHEMLLVLDWEDCRWSNVESLIFPQAQGEHVFNNLFARAPVAVSPG